MKIRTLFLLAMAMVVSSMAHAQTTDSAKLQQAATGTRFAVGSTQFRMVPSAKAQRTDEGVSTQGASKAESMASSPSNDVVGQIGPYSIVLPQDTQAQLNNRSATASTSANSNELGVAVNLNSGQAVLVPPRLKLFVENAAVIDQIAKATGGTTLHTSSAAGMGIIRYASVEAAQTALGKAKAAQGVTDASLDIIQNFHQNQ
jgi:hypothetical protein